MIENFTSTERSKVQKELKLLRNLDLSDPDVLEKAKERLCMACYREYFKALFLFFTGKKVDKKTSRVLVSNVLLKFWEMKMETLLGINPEKAERYLFKMASRELAKHREKEVKRGLKTPPLLKEDKSKQEGIKPDKAKVERIFSFIQKILTNKEFLLFCQIYSNLKADCKGVAKKLGVKVNTIQQRISRIRKKIKKKTSVKEILDFIDGDIDALDKELNEMMEESLEEALFLVKSKFVAEEEVEGCQCGDRTKIIVVEEPEGEEKLIEEEEEEELIAGTEDLVGVNLFEIKQTGRTDKAKGQSHHSFVIGLGGLNKIEREFLEWSKSLCHPFGFYGFMIPDLDIGELKKLNLSLKAKKTEPKIAFNDFGGCYSGRYPSPFRGKNGGKEGADLIRKQGANHLQTSKNKIPLTRLTCGSNKK